jgi:hypothetical protein
VSKLNCVKYFLPISWLRTGFPVWIRLRSRRANCRSIRLPGTLIFYIVVSYLSDDRFVNGCSLSLGQIFRSHGEFCASQPWEVIVATLTFLVCILTVWGRHSEHAWHTTSNNNLTASPAPGQAAPVSTAYHHPGADPGSGAPFLTPGSGFQDG